MKILVKEEVYNKYLLESVNLSSFKMQDTLCPDIFDEDDRMIPEVRKTLLQVGKDFYDYLNTPWVDLQDIVLTGSLANYNWSKFSDVDVHIVIPYSQISKNADLVDDFAWKTKELWNNEHNIKIKDYEVEMYAQDSNDTLVSSGIYSILYDKWIKKPERREVRLYAKKIGRIVNAYEDKIADLFRQFLAGDRYGLSDDIDDMKGSIRNLRKRGLSTGGEFSSENIAFKSLRRLGFLDKLSDMKSEIYDDGLSVEKSRAEKVRDGDIVNEPAKKPKKDKDDDKKTSGETKGIPQWEINGQKYISVRDAAKATGVPKSTVAYRANSDTFPSWKNLTKK